MDVYPRCRRFAPPFGLPPAGFVAALQSSRAVLGEIWTGIADRLIKQTFPRGLCSFRDSLASTKLEEPSNDLRKSFTRNGTTVSVRAYGMRYPELPIQPDHLTKIAAIERFAGSWYSMSRLSAVQRSEMAASALEESTAALLRLEGLGTDVQVVARTLASMEKHELDFSRHSEEILGLHAALKKYLSERREEENLLDPGMLMEIHGAVLEEVPTLRQKRGQLRVEPASLQAYDRNGVSVGDVLQATDPKDIPAELASAFSDARTELEERLWHPLLVISWLTARLIVIQPFELASLRSIHVLVDMLLLSNGYSYVPLQSLVATMEQDSGQYFVSVRKYQKSMTSNQDGLLDWHSFFLGSLVKQAARVRARQRLDKVAAELPPLSEELLKLAGDKGKLTLRDAAGETGANRNTIKVHLKKLVDLGTLERKGTGKGTWYEIP